jgi:hypothetical protein
MEKEYDPIENQRGIIDAKIQICESAIKYVKQNLEMKRCLETTKGIRNQIDILATTAHSLDYEFVKYDNLRWEKETYRPKEK